MNHRNSFTRHHETLDIPVYQNTTRYEMVRTDGVQDSCPNGVASRRHSTRIRLRVLFLRAVSFRVALAGTRRRRDVTCCLAADREDERRRERGVCLESLRQRPERTRGREKSLSRISRIALLKYCDDVMQRVTDLLGE